MEKIHFISYGDKKYNKAKKRIKEEAIKCNWFDNIKIYEPDDLTMEFKENFKEILNEKRGGGYWIWKLDIINQELKDLSKNDILVYCDAGCVINNKGEKRFKEYIELLKNSDECVISFQMKGCKEREWTTKEIFNYFNIDINSKEANSGQIHATILIMKKNEKLMEILDKYFKVLKDDIYLVTDKYNTNQIDKFRDNRHDQSIFSIIRKKYGSIILEDETARKYKNIEKSPFIAMRKRK